MTADFSSASEPLAPATNFFNLGAELLAEVQKMIGSSQVRALRIKFGDRVIKRIPISPTTIAATIAIVVIAVVISTMSIEVEHEPITTTA